MKPAPATPPSIFALARLSDLAGKQKAPEEPGRGTGGPRGIIPAVASAGAASAEAAEIPSAAAGHQPPLQSHLQRFRAQHLQQRQPGSAPVGNLSSPFFGQSIALGGLSSSASANRRVDLQAMFAF